MKQAIISRAIRNRTCINCRVPILPGTEHVKLYSCNLCKVCFISVAFKMLGTDAFRPEYVNKNLPKILSELV